MADILIIYSTVDGHTREICERLRRLAEQRGHTVTTEELVAGSDVDPEPFDRIVIGANSVVTGEIPSNCVAAGVPARVIKQIE